MIEYEKIKELVKNKGFNLDSVSERVGMTRVGLMRAIGNNSLKVETLEKLAEVLEVPISVFFNNKDEEKFLYFKQIISSQSVFVEIGYYVQELMGENLNIIAKSIVEFAQKEILPNEKDKLLESLFISRKKETSNERQKNEDDFSTNDADHIAIIKKHILETDIISTKRKELDKAISEAEVIFVNIVKNDAYINFLLKEQIITEEDIVSEILMTTKNFLGFVSSGAKGLLIKNFQSSALRKSLKRYLDDERYPIVSQ